jgi:hypothetical protein
VSKVLPKVIHNRSRVTPSHKRDSSGHFLISSDRVSTQAQIVHREPLPRIQRIRRTERALSKPLAKITEQQAIEIVRGSFIVGPKKAGQRRSEEELPIIALIKADVSQRRTTVTPIDRPFALLKEQPRIFLVSSAWQRLVLSKIKPTQSENEISVRAELLKPFIKVLSVESLKTKVSLKPLPSELVATQSEKSVGGGVGTAEAIDFFDLFLEMENGGSPRAALGAEEPAILILATEEGEEYGQAAQLICQEILKEKGRLDEVGAPVISKQEIEEELTPERLSSKTWLIKNVTSKTPKLVRLGKSLLQSGSPAYLIFEVEQDKAKDFYKELEEELRPYRNIYLLKLRALSLEKKELLISLWWGLGTQLDLFGYLTSQEKAPSFDNLFLWAKEKHSEFINNIGKLKKGLYEEVTKPDPSGEESPLHYRMKMFVVYHYAESEGLYSRQQIERRIKTEDADVIPGIRPDIYLEDKGVAVEVETLYESGFIALNRIRRDKLPKYERANKPVHFILPALMFLQHLQDMKNVRALHPEVDFDFYTIDLSQNRLLAIGDIEDVLGISEH